jgi:hypothetical protein
MVPKATKKKETSYKGELRVSRAFNFIISRVYKKQLLETEF